jgi:pimeloyl-ACP methyl ester carboxylesterase
MKLIQKAFLTYYSTKFRLIAFFSPQKAAKSAFELFCTPYSRRRTYEAPEAFKTAQKHSFSLQGHQIHGFEWKPLVPNSYKVLICHGFDSLSYRFARYIEPLLEQGFAVYAFDAPGHGLSTGKTINALLYRDMILEAGHRYGPFDCLIAHSFGGIAAALAIEVMKVNALKRLVLIAPATETTRSLNEFCRYLRITDAVKNELENLIQQIGGKPLSWYSVARIIPSISIRTLWLHDKKDNQTPYEDMNHLTERVLPHVEFVITEGLGHSLYRHDEVARKIIDFLVTLKTSSS